jgi:hypothetical protein
MDHYGSGIYLLSKAEMASSIQVRNERAVPSIPVFGKCLADSDDVEVSVRGSSFDNADSLATIFVQAHERGISPRVFLDVFPGENSKRPGRNSLESIVALGVANHTLIEIDSVTVRFVWKKRDRHIG